jgi:hypothetical protein
VETGKNLDAVGAEAVVKEVGKATEDRSPVSRGDLGEGLGESGHHIHGVLERANKIGAEARFSLVVPLPGRLNV